jgi:hypothetical protein
MSEKEKLHKAIERAGLQDGLVGRSHGLILEVLKKGDFCKSEIFEQVKGRNYLTAPQQVIRATDQLVEIRAVKSVGTRKTLYAEIAEEEEIYQITDRGSLLLDELHAQFKSFDRG